MGGWRWKTRNRQRENGASGEGGWMDVSRETSVECNGDYSSLPPLTRNRYGGSIHLMLTAHWLPNSTSPDNVISWLGGMQNSPTWEEYILGFDDGFTSVLEAIRACHEENQLDLYGDDLNDGYFSISDGRSVSMSMRAWGDFRQAMVGKREGYMKYYMR